jgi:hypothetical protein
MQTSYRTTPDGKGRTATTRGLLPDEPVFVIRAKDANALALVNLYRTLTQGDFEGPRAASLDADIDAIREWRRRHERDIRDPD